MAKKKNDNNNSASCEGGKEEKKEETPKKGGGEGGEKKGKEKEQENKTISVVLNIDMHCEGCASKVTKLARSLNGVESAKADTGSKKLTVVGKVDPVHIRDILHNKTHKKVDLISPQPIKEEKTNKANNRKKAKDGEEKKKPEEKKPQADKKPKETPVTTAVLKLGLHCQGCIDKIHRIVSKTKGVNEMTLDKQRETVTVKGTMDVKALTEALKGRLKRPVEVVSPPKKEKEGSGKEKEGNGKEKEKEGEKVGEKKGKGGQENAGGGNGTKTEGNKVEFLVHPGFGPGYGFVGQPVYQYELVGRPVYPDGYVPGRPVHPYGYDYRYGYGPDQGFYIDHMQFNDENPHACFIM